MHVAVTAPRSLLLVAARRAWTMRPIVVEVVDLDGLPNDVATAVEEQLPSTMITSLQLAELERDEKIVIERLEGAPVDAESPDDAWWARTLRDHFAAACGRGPQ